MRRLGWSPLRPIRRTIRLAVIGLVGSALLPIVAVFLAAAFGWIDLDLSGFSGFAQSLDKLGYGAAKLPPLKLMVLLQLIQVPFGAIINGLLTLGEETGWRGFLLPALRPLGTWPALLVSGAAWGLWHAPIVLLGYNFDRPNIGGLAPHPVQQHLACRDRPRRLQCGGWVLRDCHCGRRVDEP